MIDKKMNDLVGRMETNEYFAFSSGLNFAIERLRANEYYGHYAKQLADWLESHFDGDVSNPSPTSLKGDKNGK